MKLGIPRNFLEKSQFSEKISTTFSKDVLHKYKISLNLKYVFNGGAFRSRQNCMMGSFRCSVLNSYAVGG